MSSPESFRILVDDIVYEELPVTNFLANDDDTEEIVEDADCTDKDAELLS